MGYDLFFFEQRLEKEVKKVSNFPRDELIRSASRVQIHPIVEYYICKLIRALELTADEANFLLANAIDRSLRDYVKKYLKKINKK